MDTKYLLVGVAVALLACLFHKYFIAIYDYWRKRGVPCVAGALPVVGNTLSVILMRQGFGQLCDEIYRANPGRSMVGFFQFREPHLLIRDPELVKTVLISGFPNFHVNVLEIDPALDPLTSKNPFFNVGEAWKNERSRLTGALMSSKRLRVLLNAVNSVCAKFSRHLEDSARQTSGGVLEFDAKDLFNRFTGEVVASAGFGVEGDFFSNGSGPNSFRENVQGLFDPTAFNILKQTLLFFVPVLNKILRVSFMPERMDRFFRRMVGEMIDARLKNGTERNDFLQVMMDMHKAKGENIDVFGITASATSFFLDGYETSAVTLSFFAYQVAAHPHVQDRLREEVTTVLKKYDGQLTYEALAEMTYMDQALNESMRLFPAILFIFKRCNEKCQLVGEDGVECHVEPGTVVAIPIHALQTDPLYWENPEVYDPDRFSEENKKTRPKTVFMPFGEGPRICVGMRFALIQIKAAMVTMLRNWRLGVSPKTRVPLKLKATPILTAVEGELWITMESL